MDKSRNSSFPGSPTVVDEIEGDFERDRGKQGGNGASTREECGGC